MVVVVENYEDGKKKSQYCQVTETFTNNHQLTEKRQALKAGAVVAAEQKMLMVMVEQAESAAVVLEEVVVDAIEKWFCHFGTCPTTI